MNDDDRALHAEHVAWACRTVGIDPEAFYEQIAQDLRADIAAGLLPSDHPIPAWRSA